MTNNDRTISVAVLLGAVYVLGIVTHVLYVAENPTAVLVGAAAAAVGAVAACIVGHE